LNDIAVIDFWNDDRNPCYGTANSYRDAEAKLRLQQIPDRYKYCV
jgi:hypothetical protein